jgi:predicted RNA methylase
MYDLDPRSPDITQQDFFTADHQHQPGLMVIQNPPFGRGSDLAIRFFNKAATFADYIAQIVPRTFRRPSIQNRLGDNFELVDEYVQKIEVYEGNRLINVYSTKHGEWEVTFSNRYGHVIEA